ncbi:MAG: glycoside hydrolase family 3 protein [Defluviitaleaceae bacterium]|nr:glycoside hydrolase family 3 protein [Defluviitaleaceae bacterium]
MQKRLYTFFLLAMLVLSSACVSNGGNSSDASNANINTVYAAEPSATPAAESAAAASPRSSSTTVPTETPATSATSSPTPSPTTSPTPSPAEQLLASMTLDDKISQLFFLAFRQDANGANITEVNGEIRGVLENHAIGGVILFSENIETKEQTQKYVSGLQALAKIPLFIGIDEEGGRVLRTSALDVPRIPAALKIGASGDPRNAYDAAQTIAGYLSPLGVNLDFAPVADVFTNPDNTVIGDRAFSTDADTAAGFVVQFVAGLQDNGLSACLKHFPGHGDTATDSHYGLAETDRTLDELTAREFIPFEKGIDAGADFVMVGHIAAPLVTGNDDPATFSPLMMSILRDTLGFGGVIITDSLQMGAVSVTSGEAAVRAFSAGADMLLMPDDFDEAFTAIKDAVDDEKISIERLDQSVLRILELKEKKGMLAGD